MTKNKKRSVRIRWAKGELIADLEDTPTVRKLLEALPCRSRANTWGEEVYFEVPIQADLERDADQVVNPGAVCFWVQGRSLAIPFGATPISEDGECRMVTRVNLLGKVRGDPRILRSVRDGDSIWMEPMDKSAPGAT